MPLWLLQTTILASTTFLAGLMVLVSLRQPTGWKRWLVSITLVGGAFLALTVSCAADKARHDDQNLQHRTASIDLLDDLLTQLRDMETGQRGFLLTGQPEYLHPYHEAANAVPNTVSKLLDMANAGVLPVGEVKTLAQLVDNKGYELAQTIQLYKEQGREAALNVVNNHEGRRAMVDIRLHVKILQGQLGAQIRHTQAQQLGNLEQLGWSALSLAILSALGFLTMAYSNNTTGFSTQRK